jgi:succinate dehydrogenase / fumarate reductase flavoprotein subunit
MTHTLCWVGKPGEVSFDYRPVHQETLSDEVEAIPPKARVY